MELVGGSRLDHLCENRARMDDGANTGEQFHPLVGGFGDAVNYEASRPRYDERVVATLVEHLDLSPGVPVLELGAGTGQLSRALVAAGLDLIAVEPLAQTRSLLAEAIGAERVRDGRAEAIPLQDGTVQAVLAADSFHWFDERRAVPEIKRVLRPAGGVAILRAIPTLEDPWRREIGEIIARTRPEHFGERGAAAALEEDPDFGPVVRADVRTRWSYDRARLLAWVSSFSWVGTLPAQARAALLSEVEEVLVRHRIDSGEGSVLSQIWIARLR
jgi:SAM-dependent methyltransferase